jgi:putative copper resistance protein D
VDRYEIATALLRGLHVAALLSLFGCLVLRRFVVPKGAVEPPLAAVDRITVVSAVLALVAGGAWLAAVAGTIAGANGIASLLAAVPLVARHTNFGNFVCARLLLLAAVFVPLALQDPRARIAALLIAGAALALQPMLGHIGASGAREILIPIEAAHLLAAGAWLGGLLPLLLCVVRAPQPLAAKLCDRFTPVGLVAVGTIAVTALPQAGELIGGFPGLFGTQYGHMALIKLGLFCLALGLACINRLLLTPPPWLPAPWLPAPWLWPGTADIDRLDRGRGRRRVVRRARRGRHGFIGAGGPCAAGVAVRLAPEFGRLG